MCRRSDVDVDRFVSGWRSNRIEDRSNLARRLWCARELPDGQHMRELQRDRPVAFTSAVRTGDGSVCDRELPNGDTLCRRSIAATAGSMCGVSIAPK